MKKFFWGFLFVLMLLIAAHIMLHYGAVNTSRTEQQNIQWRYEHALNH